MSELIEAALLLTLVLAFFGTLGYMLAYAGRRMDAYDHRQRGQIRVGGFTPEGIRDIERRAASEDMSPEMWCSMAVSNALQDERSVLHPAWVEDKIAKLKATQGDP